MNFKKILVAVDASDNSARAVEYTGVMTGKAGDCDIHLFYAERLPERDIYPDEESWCAACQEEQEKIRVFLDKAREILLKHGVKSERITVNYLPGAEFTCPSGRKAGRSVADQIMHAQKEGGFGTVVVGRRGVSKAEEFLFGSVSTKIIHHIKNCSVWVVE
ncbi:universal stress protein [Desulfonatronovibrio hydrogenovorans]|uniref:universal stress protein n=1 Tax=Desulfonatronovibrio hydrogenovorans TaxID=53245 RepID=UPI00048EA5D8|nr:universal stress protein [Desulfonatronovibrio hydrogenovorans]